MAIRKKIIMGADDDVEKLEHFSIPGGPAEWYSHFEK